MKYGIIGAMESEVEHLKAELRDAQQHARAGMQFYEGFLGNTAVVVVRCGVGKVDAALCAQVLVDLFHVDAIINTGVAGAVDSRLNVGDVVISIDAVHHDVDATRLGYAYGEVPDLGCIFFEADADLRTKAREAVVKVAPEINCIEGRVASGDQFISSPSEKERLLSRFNAACCEMEGASIAHAAWLNKLPFVIVRAISDKADGSAMVDYPSFVAEAALRCAKIVEYMVQS